MNRMTFIDRNDGTGVDVSIDSLPGASAIYTSRVQDGVPFGGWLQQTVSDANLTRSLDLTPGFYWSILVPASGVPTLPQAFVTANGLESAAHQIRDSIVEKLKAFNLPQIGQAVYGQHNYAHGVTLEFPCIHVSSVELSEEEKDGTNLVDEIHYPYRVMCFDRFSPNDSEEEKKYRKWRETIYRGFRNQPLLGLPYVKQVLVNPLAITPEGVVQMEGVPFELFITGFNFYVVTADPRGWGV